jgi:hypothetical protein
LSFGQTEASSTTPGAKAISDAYGDDARRIIEAATAGNDAWKKMRELCDGIGHRLSGSESLERAIRWALDTMKADGAENVRGEKVMVPKWVRGDESATLIEPRHQRLGMLGLGGSVGTPPEGITAEVVAVRDKEHLDELGEAVRGKIVLFNYAMPPYSEEKGTSYGPTVRYRGNGARWAAEYGAVAALVRSVTARSLHTPHTGAMNYGDAETKIPSAAVTIEDAESIARLCEAGGKVVVRLKMEARTHDDAESANAIGELVGREKPDEVVVIGGHIDSWDVGQGAHDDGGGCVIAMEAINVLRKLNLRPRRTIRVVLFTNEENGLRGGRAYAEDHKEELAGHVAAIESDSGVFAPRSYGVSINDEAEQAVAVRQLGDIVTLLEPVGPIRADSGGGGADIGPMGPAGVPTLGHEVDMSRYFDYHHTNADTLDKVDPEELSKNVAALAVMAYVLADMPGRLGEE